MILRKFESIVKVLEEFGFSDVIGRTDGETPYRIIASKDGAKYYHILPQALEMVDITPKKCERLFELKVTFACDKVVAVTEPCFHSTIVTIKRNVGKEMAILLDNWMYDFGCTGTERMWAKLSKKA